MLSIKEKLNLVIKEEKLLQSNVAKELGYTPAVLSAYLKGTYTGDNKAVEKAIENWLKTQEKKVRVFVEAPHFIEIPTAKKVFSALDMAKILPTMVTVYGASGVGKTKACQEYAKNNQNVWMITASPARATLSSILFELALALGINDAPRRKDRLSRMITKKIKGTQGLVIVDESDHLPYDALEELRIIQEEAEVGFALIGNDKVYTRIQGGINQAHEYARLWSRIGNNCGVKASTKGDIKAIAQAWGLDITDKDLMTVLYDIGGKAGGLRALTQYLRLAGMTAKGQGTVITLDLILTAQAQMKGAN
ncbi:AAA family ATPase [Pasteurella caecimuris]|uniref:AAA family ATPase n=1 Tax=Rodentibacter caecimuris TaxID=1796644 RepID=UPI00214FCE31|nr:AAA family ATPase [Pasteurella caecimuris]MCR1838628.1 AAA family ATPase [Pasteurella caecimuris]MCU0108070.1 AAA family ATPase [Pasteurella caecimuris]